MHFRVTRFIMEAGNRGREEGGPRADGTWRPEPQCCTFTQLSPARRGSIERAGGGWRSGDPLPERWDPPNSVLAWLSGGKRPGLPCPSGGWEARLRGTGLCLSATPCILGFELRGIRGHGHFMGGRVGPKTGCGNWKAPTRRWRNRGARISIECTAPSDTPASQHTGTLALGHTEPFGACPW